MSNDDIDDPVMALMDAVLDQCQRHNTSRCAMHTTLLVIIGESTACWSNNDDEFEKSLAGILSCLEKIARNSWADKDRIEIQMAEEEAEGVHLKH